LIGQCQSDYETANPYPCLPPRSTAMRATGVAELVQRPCAWHLQQREAPLCQLRRLLAVQLPHFEYILIFLYISWVYTIYLNLLYLKI
jgi:hypothetical protein